MRAFVGLGVMAAVLAGCSTNSDDVGSLLVQPGKYQFLRCQDLTIQASTWLAREKDLNSLIERANEGGGGSMISAAVYGPELAQARGHIRVIKQTMIEKNCDGGGSQNPTSGAVLR